MKSITKIILIFLFFTITISAQSNSGNTGSSFLKIGHGSAELALGESVSSSYITPFSLNYNPALLSNELPNSIGFMHNEWLKDVRTEYLVTKFSLFGLPFSFNLNSTNISNIEIRTKPGDPVGTFTANYFSTGLATAFTIYDKINFGFRTKFLYENIYSNEASGYAFDFGLLYKSLFDKVNISLAINNIGSMNKLRNEESKLPSEFRIGLSYFEPIKANDFSFLPLLEIQKYFNNDGLRFSAGVETAFKDFIFLRLGYKSNSDIQNLSTGIGLRYKNINFDYAFIPFNQGLGSGNIFSLYLNL